MELPWKKLWDKWDLRYFIILSLSLQTLLTFVAPLRKRMSSNWIIISLWSAYLLADWAANFAVGLISNSNNNTTSGAVNNGDLEAFWATFFLVHLGGPDTITAFALEDNELWLRHLLSLVVQCLAALYIFFQTLPGNKIWIPTMLVFVAGIIKYSERTRSLYLASFGNLRESMRRVPPVYHQVVKEFHSGRATVGRFIQEGAGDARVLTELEVISEASSFFDSLKELIVNSIVTFELDDGEYLFGTIMAGDAFGIIELELNLMYEILYTKVSVVHCKSGYICRSFCFSSVVVALALFHSEEKQGFDGFDVGITYVLLLGAIVLDIIAIVMLFFSNSTIITLMSIRCRRSTSNWVKNWVKKMLNFLLAVKRRRRIADAAKPPRSCCMLMRLIGQFLHRGWSESVSQFNLINYCINKRSRWMQKLIDIFHLTNVYDRHNYVKRVSFTRELRDFIFKELRTKAWTWRHVGRAKEIYSGRGEGVLRDRGHHNLLPSVEEVEYDRSLLLWHIATELCYSTDGKSNAAACGTGNDDDNIGKYRNFSNLLSDYMLYLLVMQQQMMAAVAGDGYIRFIHTCSETKHIFQRRKSQVQQVQTRARPSIFGVNDFFCREKSEENEQIRACNTILSIDTTFNFEEDIYVKSVLFDACRLAKALRKLGEKDKWETISSVWVELLCYAASRCGEYTHVQQLNKGGELITLVWLLMVHLGLCGRYQDLGSFQPLNFNPSEEQVVATPHQIRTIK
ncbi:uncharacterized protein LOC132305369 [Cornus florida]|uniref:uncharacterized protein LOC132305369 n=1 Tax=Cornus florida TaxID=4283 RepID=UPI0028A0E061|nr:uncharacterized protein LOC132305369 [Cornus florida]